MIRMLPIFPPVDAAEMLDAGALVHLLLQLPADAAEMSDARAVEALLFLHLGLSAVAAVEDLSVAAVVMSPRAIGFSRRRKVLPQASGCTIRTSASPQARSLMFLVYCNVNPKILFLFNARQIIQRYDRLLYTDSHRFFCVIFSTVMVTFLVFHEFLSTC